MAKQKKEEVETSSATLDAGTVIHGPADLVDRLSGGGSGSTSTGSTSSTSSTSTRRSSTDK